MKKREKQIQVVRDLLQIGAFLQKTGNRIAGEFGLTQQQFVVLNEIVEKGGINQKQIVGALLFEKSNVSKVVKKLHTLGLIHVASDPEDARSTMLSITMEGEGLWRECLGRMNAWSQTWLEPQNHEELEAFSRMLARLKDLIPSA